MKKLPYCKAPCKQCPFRKDSIEGWLGEERMTDILQSGSFVCHKTTNGEMSDRRQCAGHMIIKGLDNDFVRLGALCGVAMELNGKDLIFDNEKDLIKHHSH